MTKKEKYELIDSQIKSLCDGVKFKQANLANISSLLYHELPDVSWVGFYLFEDDKLVLNSFQGKPACVVIEKNKGVCGKAFSENKIIVVPNVHEFVGHIACDSLSNSEIVIPLRKENKVIGVLDIDSYLLNRFLKGDVCGLAQIGLTIEKYL